MRILRRLSRVVAISVAGGVLIVAGVVMLVTPGPGILSIVAGLAILAHEFNWAERLKSDLIARVRDATQRGRVSRIAERFQSTDRPAEDDVPQGQRDVPAA